MSQPTAPPTPPTQEDDPAFLLHPDPSVAAEAAAESLPAATPPGRSASILSMLNPFAHFRSSHWPTSSAKAEEAETQLLSRLRFFGTGAETTTPTAAAAATTTTTAATSRTIVRVGQVDIGEGRFINTLIVDESHSTSEVIAEPGQQAVEGVGDGGGKAAAAAAAAGTQKDGKRSCRFGYTPGCPQTQLEISRPSDSAVVRGPQQQLLRANRRPRQRYLVIAHGFGAGLGFFYRNYHGLSQTSMDVEIHAIDWLGLGRSSRTPLPPLRKPDGTPVPQDQIVTESENYFVDSLEDWRKRQGIEKMTLCGHSLGGYLSAVYALKYPERVESLILASPVGIPENPLTKSIGTNVSKDSTNDTKNKSSNNADNNVNDDPMASAHPTPRRQLPGWVEYLWKSHYTPQYIIRLLGPYGPSMVRQYTERRFAFLDQEDREALRSYIYHVSAAIPASENAITRLLAPGAYAYKPLVNRLHDIKMPTLFLYGDHDWMEKDAADLACQRMSVKTRVDIIKDAGHHLYLDNPPEFNKSLLNWMSETTTGQ